MVDVAKKRKYLQYGVAAVVVGVPFLTLAIWMKPDERAARNGNGDEALKMDLATLTDGGKESDLWMAKSGNRLDALEKELKSLTSSKRDEVAALEEQVAALEAELKKEVDSAIQIIDMQAAEIEEMEAKLANKENAAQEASGGRLTVPTQGTFPNGDFVRGVSDGGAVSTPAQGGAAFTAQARVPQKISLALEGSDSEIKTFSTEYYVPAGSYANAMVIQGVEASVGISSASDPRPVLLRVTGKAISAFHEGDQEMIDLTGCLVTGAARGDLSSEKVYIRLINMTCSRESGRVFEVAVKGYVSAQGSAGIRGPVISREGEFTEKAFTAGMFSGIGGAASSLSQPSTAFTGLGAIQDKPSLMDVLGQGVGEGIGEAGNLLSQYYIERAEQYQPVVVTRPGTVVDIIFEEGVSLNAQS